MRHNRPTSVAVLVGALIAALPLLGGCESEPVGSAPVTATRTVVTDPFGPGGGLAPGLELVNEVTADCARSLLSPENPRARRCFTNETTLVRDPCFVPPAPNPEAPNPEAPNPETLEYDEVDTIALCLRDPEGELVTKAYVLDDESAAWGTEDTARGTEDAVDPWWFVELADGTRCVKVLGVPEIRHAHRQPLQLSYHCDNGYLYGIPDQAERVWTIHHRLEDSDTLTVAEIRTAWS